MDNNINVLIIEDNEDINNLLSEVFKNNGYYTVSAYSGTEALIYLKDTEFDMIILDLMIPGISGENLLIKIRKNKQMPIIIISAKEEKDIKIKTLKMGADDYITKPFDIDEVLARIDANIRRYKSYLVSSYVNNTLKYKEIYLNKDTREIFIKNNKVELTFREFEILKLLMENPKKVFSKSNLFESVWNSEYLGDDNTISVHISNLRSKLNNYSEKQIYIKTVWGIGYKLD